MTEGGFWFDLENHKPPGWDEWWTGFDRLKNALGRSGLGPADFCDALEVAGPSVSVLRLGTQRTKSGKQTTKHSTLAEKLILGLRKTAREDLPGIITFDPTIEQQWQKLAGHRHDLADMLSEMVDQESKRIRQVGAELVLEQVEVARRASNRTRNPDGGQRPPPIMVHQPVQRPTALRKIGRLNATLLERGEGNSGTFDAPDVEVELVFGEEEVEDALDDAPAVMQLHACSLRVDFEGGSIVKPLVGEDVSFNIAYRNADGQRVDTRVPFMPNVAGNSPAHWDAETQRGRRLYGTSSRELLCQFSQRPDTLSVSLVANPHSLRLFKRAESGELEPVKTKDMVGRVVALLARMEVLGEDVATFEEFRIDGGDLIR